MTETIDVSLAADYEPGEIEPKWQQAWRSANAFQTPPEHEEGRAGRARPQQPPVHLGRRAHGPRPQLLDRRRPCPLPARPR